MTHIDSTTTVTFTMTQLIGGIVGTAILAGGVLWTVLTFTVGGMRADVGAIRTSIQELQKADKETALRGRDSEGKLAEQIAGLRTDLATFGGRMDTFANRVTTLDGSVSKLTNQVADLQKILFARAQSFTSPDPRVFETFKRAIQGAGVDAGKIVVVPFDMSGAPLAPDQPQRLLPR